MKTEKIIVDLILFIGNLIGFCGIYSSLYIFKVVSIEAYMVMCFVTTMFYTKQQINQHNLENKIFELKELIETLKK